MASPTFFSKDAWRGIFIAIIAVVAGQMVLAWQYYRLEERRLPQLEQELKEQREQIERESAKTSLASFLDALGNGDGELARRYVTENAVVQEERGVFSFENAFADYEIVELRENGVNEFRAQVDIRQTRGLPSQVYLLRVLKVLDTYYIDSFQPAG